MKLATRAMFYFFKIFGLAPMSFEATWLERNKSWRWIFSKSRFGTFYNVFLICLTILINAFGVRSMYATNYQGNTSQDTTLTVIEDTVIAASTVLILTIYCYLQSDLVTVLKKINYGREYATIMDVNVRLNDNVLFDFVTFICACNVGIMLISLFFELDRAGANVAIYYFIYVSDNLLATMVTFQYSAFLKMLQKMIAFVNENLDDVLIKSRSCSEVGDTENYKLVLEIDQLMKFHTLVCEISRDVSKFYSFPMLLSILEFFIILNHGLYFSVKDLVILNKGLTYSSFIDLFGLYLSLTSITTLTIYVSVTCQEVKVKNLNLLLKFFHLTLCSFLSD